MKTQISSETTFRAPRVEPRRSELLARLVLFFLLAAAGLAGALVITRPARSAQAAYEIHARMPENGGWSAETLYTETGKPLRLRLTSDDTLHSFAIGQSDRPAVEIRPGEWSETSLVFDQPGRYTFYCTVWCGRNHWRMRGTIEVSAAGAGETIPNSSTGNEPANSGSGNASAVEKPLYLRLGLNLDAPHAAEEIPAAPLSTERGAALAARLPAYALDPRTYWTSSPSALFLRLRAEDSIEDLSGAALWDAIAYLWARQTTPTRLAEAQQLYAANCAACHGETGNGNGAMVTGLPRFDPANTHAMQGSSSVDASGMGLSAPPDFTDPRGLLGASPALLEGKMLRGGMGTGMPYWGPIFTRSQLDALVAYLYTFALQR